jgi:rubrerythrin
VTSIHSLPEFYAHALAIEEEAAARYRELGDQMTEHHNPGAAELFFRLAGLERKHAAEIGRRAQGVSLPQIAPWGYQWQGAESPETAPHESAHYLMTPWHALELALANEKRAVEFFESVARTSRDEAVARLAQEFAAEERMHVTYVEQALASQADPTAGWDEDLDDPQAVE